MKEVWQEKATYFTYMQDQKKKKKTSEQAARTKNPRNRLINRENEVFVARRAGACGKQMR